MGAISGEDITMMMQERKEANGKWSDETVTASACLQILRPTVLTCVDVRRLQNIAPDAPLSPSFRFLGVPGPEYTCRASGSAVYGNLRNTERRVLLSALLAKSDPRGLGRGWSLSI